jgi:hypothetical protein
MVDPAPGPVPVSSGIGARERVTILCDPAGEFEKAVQRTGRPLCRIVDGSISP